MLERRLPDRFVSMADVQWLQEGGRREPFVRPTRRHVMRLVIAQHEVLGPSAPR